MNEWIARLFEDPALLRMGHNQRAEDNNLGLGWLYYALGRIVRPRIAVAIGSYRGFAPLVIARALRDNAEPGELLFIDPSLVDDFWKDPARVQAYFAAHGLENVRHFPLKTQQFVDTETYADLDSVGLLFVDGLHTAEQARFDFDAFRDRLAPRAIVLFHDSMVTRDSALYGADRSYRMTVPAAMEELRRDPEFELFDIPFGTGVTLLRRRGDSGPLLEGIEGRIK